jgi:hypothetical protein
MYWTDHKAAEHRYEQRQRRRYPHGVLHPQEEKRLLQCEMEGKSELGKYNRSRARKKCCN